MEKVIDINLLLAYVKEYVDKMLKVEYEKGLKYGYDACYQNSQCNGCFDKDEECHNCIDD